MITSFRCKETEKIWRQEYSKKFPRPVQRIALRKLLMIHRAQNLQDLSVPPGNRLEKLKGDRTGAHSIRVNNQYRICLVWNKGIVSDVELIDYHS